MAYMDTSISPQVDEPQTYSFVLVYSAESKLTVRRAWMLKSQGQTRELYSVLMRIRLDCGSSFESVGGDGAKEPLISG